jgi:hypothetical protein
MSVVPHFKDLKVYSDSKTMIKRQHVDFPSSLIGISTFPDNMIWVNSNGKLYMTGGLVNGTPIPNFLVYDVFANNISRLSDMTTARDNHSMLLHDNFIYVVGGSDTNTCEKYNLQTSAWIKLNSLQSGATQRSILLVKNNFLYAFFGILAGEYVDHIERLNLKNLKSKWEYVSYKNPDNIDLKMIGSGIIEIGDSEIYMFGGKTKDEVKNTAISYDFKDNTFRKLDLALEDGTYFMESKLLRFGNDTYGQFNLNKDDILKLQIS